MIPVIGNIADLVNGGIYLCRGKYADAALSFAAATPGAGQGVTLLKWANRGSDIVKAADKVRDTTRLIDKASDIGRSVDRIGDARDAAKASKKSVSCLDLGIGCFVADTQVVLRVISRQTVAAWLGHEENELPSERIDRSYSWVLAVGTIAVGLGIALPKKEEEDELRPTLRRCFFSRLGQDDLDLSEPWESLPDPEPHEHSAEVIDSLCERLFNDSDVLEARFTTPLDTPTTPLPYNSTRGKGKANRNAPVVILDSPQKTASKSKTKRKRHDRQTLVIKTEPVKQENHTSRSKPRCLRRYVALSLILLGSLFFGYQAFSAVSTPPEMPAHLAAPVAVVPSQRCETANIQDLQVGQTLPAVENPDGEHDTQFGETVEPEHWRKLTLVAPKKDGSISDVTLLRPVTWLEEQNAFAGGEVWIEVPECGISGQAKLIKIEPCPEIQGDGQIITGTFRHQARSILDVYIKGEPEPIGTTPNHPFWSEKAQKFVRADELSPGSRLQAIDGSLRNVEAVVSHSGDSHTVYNLEVQCSHVYNVGYDGLLVHNSKTCPPTTPHTVASGGKAPKTGKPNSIHEVARADGSKSVTYYDSKGRAYSRDDFGQLHTHKQIGAGPDGRALPHEHQTIFSDKGPIGKRYRELDENGNPVGPWCDD